MGVFASEVKKDVLVEGVTVTVRKLSGRSLEKAAEARQIALGATVRSFGSDLIKTFRETKREETPEAQKAARYAGYDRSAVLVAGVASWDFERKLNPEAIDDLEESAAEFLFREILELSLPPAEVAAEAEKKA